MVLIRMVSPALLPPHGAILILWMASLTEAFLVPFNSNNVNAGNNNLVGFAPNPRIACTSLYFGSGSNNNHNRGGSNDDDFSSSSFDVEEARRQLESLLVKDNKNKNKSTQADPTTQVTTKPHPYSPSPVYTSFLFAKPNKHSQQQQPASSSSTTSGDLSSIAPEIASKNSNNNNDDDNTYYDVFGSADTVDLSFLDAPLRQALRPKASRGSSGRSSSSDDPTTTPLTTMEVKRRELEIQLLRGLEHGDESTEDLWTLWFQERGTVGLEQLMQVEQFMASDHPAMWDEAEDLLQEIIVEHGVSWVEPLNRLATLYFKEGRLHESQQLCELVLQQKPWHFGALSGIVLIHAALEQQQQQHGSLSSSSIATQQHLWAQLRMPPLLSDGDGSSNDAAAAESQKSKQRRRLWVQTAVQQAQDQLQQKSQHSQSWWGPQDDDMIHNSDHNNIFEANNEDEDAWQ